MNKKMTVVAVTALLLLGGTYFLRAQMGGGPGGPGGQGQRPMMRQPMGGMGAMGGGAAMVVYEKHIYVLSGPALLKIDPVAMKVVKELPLRRGGAGGQQGMPADDPMDGQ